VACRLLSFSRLFYILFSFFLDFLHFRHIHVFTCDTPVFCGFLDFFARLSWFATRRGFGLFSTFLSCFVWTVPV